MANFSKPAQQPPGSVLPHHIHRTNKEPTRSSFGSSKARTSRELSDVNSSRSDTNAAEDIGHERAQRSRKVSSKVQEQRAQEAEERQRREKKAARQTQRAQRNAPDTEDEDEGLNSDEEDSDENNENNNQFSSRVVPTKLSKAPAASQPVPRPPLVFTQARVPISSNTADEEAEQDQDFADIEDDQNLAASKRHRSSSVESLQDTKMQKTGTNARPKASDYDDIMKECISEAITEYRCRISAQYPFPDHATETQLSRAAWDAACKELDFNGPLIPRVSKLITIRGSHTRGELKTKARPIVEMFYGFESGHNKKIIASNRELAEALKDGMGYAYKVHHSNHSERKGLYRNKLIQKILNAMWFRNRQDEGVVREDFFRPIFPETIALILTVIECCIDEWITGIRTDCPFTAAAYRDVYDEHLKCLSDFATHTKKKAPGLFENICEKLYNRGRFHAGAQPISTMETRSIPTSAFEAAVQEYIDDEKTETDGETGDSQ